jgi:hypothetical protein
MSSRPRLAEILGASDPDFPSNATIIADTIASQLDADDTQAGQSWPAASYGTIVLPAPNCFVEARTVVDGQIVDRGLLVGDITQEAPLLQTMHRRGLTHPPGTSQVLALHGFMRVDDSDVILFPGLAFLHLDHQGHLLDDPDQVQLVRLPDEALIEGATYHPHFDVLATLIPFALRALGTAKERR